MSTRQYIGARYVPKFYDFGGSSEWRSGVAYEPLTIVTRNGNSYTSKVPVPANIGAPESNQSYWASTGIYNEQIEAYREQVQELVDSVDLLTPANRRFIFVADSYGMRVRPSYVDLIKANFALDSSSGYDLSTSGAGFARPGNTFLSVLQGASSTIANPDTITDIVVGGGFNDANYYRNGTINANDILTAISGFAQYCHTTYPNAKLWLHFDAYANMVMATDTTIGEGGAINIFIGRTEKLYASAGRYGFAYMGNVKYTLHDAELLDETYFHPNATGNVYLAANIISYLRGGDCSVSNAKQLTITLDPAFTLSQGPMYFFQEIRDGLAAINLGTRSDNNIFVLEGSVNLRPIGHKIKIGSFSGANVLFCGAREFCGTVPVALYNTENSDFVSADANVFLQDCNLYITVPSTIDTCNRIFIGSFNLTLPTMGADNGTEYMSA